MPADQAIMPDRSRSPFELDLGRLVDFSKPNFNGRRALLEEQKHGSRFRFVQARRRGQQAGALGLHLRQGQERRRHGDLGGVVAVGEGQHRLASLHMPWGRPGDELWAEIYYQRELKWSRVMARCRVVEGAFFDPPRRRATPAADF